MKNLVILGAGTGGAILANTMTRKLSGWKITVVDKAAEHIYQPGLLFIPFGLYGYKTAADVTQPVRNPLPKDVNFVSATVNGIDTQGRKVETTAGTIPYDWLILAMGCRIAPEEVEGLAEGMGINVFTFYDLPGALALQKALDGFKGGRLVLNLAETPIKCPVAPIEFVFLADYYFHQKGIRDRVEIVLVTPLTGAFTKPVATAALDKLAREKNIGIVPGFDLASVDHEAGVIRSYSGKEERFELLVSIPPNLGPEVIEDSGLGNGVGYAVVDMHTLKSKKAENTYALGDNTDCPTSKAGSVAHFEAEVVETNLLRELEGKEPLPGYDGHSNCFIESGYGKAMLIDFNYEVEPLPGMFPLPHLGPMSLLKETRLNHWGKLAFKQIYWNLLLAGRLPGDPLLPVQMSMEGKDISLLDHHGGKKT